jgi:hypothetical protein
MYKDLVVKIQGATQDSILSVPAECGFGLDDVAFCLKIKEKRHDCRQAIFMPN